MIAPPNGQGVQICDDWRLTPEGAAIHLGERTAVVADLHLGYEWARGRGRRLCGCALAGGDSGAA